MTIIRLSQIEDLKAIMPIYDSARDFMARTGNPNQWINGYPAECDIRKDIENQCHYVIEHKDYGRYRKECILPEVSPPPDKHASIPAPIPDKPSLPPDLILRGGILPLA
jgi:hypothetical protein